MSFFTKTKMLFVSATLLVSASNVSLAAEYEFKLHHFLSPKAPAHAKMLEPWADRIMKASDGRIKIEIFPSMTLGGKPPQLPRQVRDGVVDMAWIVNAYAAGQFVRTEVFELPGVHQGNNSAINKAMLEMYNNGMLGEDFKGVRPLFQHVHSGQAMQMATEEIRSPDDLKGKKMRIPSRTGAWTLESLGASPIQTSVGEIPVALSKKVIDGALIPFEIIPALKIQEQTQYQIEGPNGKRLGTSSFSVLMNEDRWNGLPADIQKIFLDNSGAEWHAEVGKIWDEAEAGGLAVAVKAGNKHVQLSDEEWAAFDKATASVIDRWLEEMSGKGIDGKALYDEATRLIEKNSAAK